MKEYLSLEKLHDDFELPVAPSEYMVLDCYYILLKNMSDKYIVLVYPTYNINERGQIDECIWSAPYVTHKVHLDSMKRIHRVGRIKKMYNEWINDNKYNISNASKIHFYHMGIDDYEIEPINSYIEYKKSKREPEKYKCYFIRNYYVSEIDRLGILNIADSEFLKGFHYLKINNGISTFQTDKTNFDSEQLYYLGKPLATNLTEFIKTSSILMNEHKYINVDDKLLYHTENGMIFMLDLNLSGVAKMYIEKNFMSFDKDGNDMADEFISKVNHIMVETFAKYNIAQYRLDGDGFIASIPSKHYYLIGASVEILKQIKSVCTEITDRINMVFSKSGLSISSKVSIASGEYRYGKLGGLDSTNPAYGGKLFFKIARNLGALKKYLVSSQINQSINDVFFCFDGTDENMIKDLVNGQFLFLSEHSIEEKESIVLIRVYNKGDMK